MYTVHIFHINSNRSIDSPLDTIENVKWYESVFDNSMLAVTTSERVYYYPLDKIMFVVELPIDAYL